MASDYQSLADMFLQRISRTPDAVAFQFPVEGTWKALTWKEAGDRVKAISCGLRALGLLAEDRCAILSSTRVEWILSDLGILCAAGATTTIYPSSTAEECAYILKDSEAKFCFIEDEQQLARLVDQRAQLKGLRKVICFSPLAEHRDWVLSLADLEALGKDLQTKEPATFERVAMAVSKNALASLIYTSGTTGVPKGVELAHDCWLHEAEGVDALGLLSPADQQYLWLPLAHVFGKVLEAVAIRIGLPTAVDGRLERMVDNLPLIRPTFVCAVPRFFEKLYNRVMSSAKEGGALKSRLFNWALAVGRRVSDLRLSGKRASGFLAIQHAIADKLVFSKLREKLGGRLRFFVSGSAPLAPAITQFFHAAGILILEGYGLTECSAVATVNRPGQMGFGTVGPPLPGTEVRLAAEDGEVLIRGRNVMRGYHGKPQETREALDSEGWLHTGDIGILENGLLRITDRKKDLIKTSVGKFVAPQMLETQFKTLCPYVSQILVFGDRRNYCTALVSLDEAAITKWASENGLTQKSYADLAADPKVRALIQSFFDQLNSGLANYETIKKFAILANDLSERNGELTPSLKVKRRQVEQNYKALLDELYGQSIAAA